MASEAPRRSEPADPLAAYSVLSLFPRTLGVLKEAPKPYDLECDLDSLHDHLKSIALRSPKRLLDQAKAIVSNSSELVNISIPTKVASEDKNRVNAVMANEVTRKRRPASGRERPRFSLKLDSSHPMVTLEPTFDVDIYEDPDEFFQAFEMFDNARSEIHRQTGVPVHQNQYDTVRNARPRRPETLRKSFKNRFDQSVICSQVTSQNDIVPGPVYTTQPEAIELTEETELAGSEMAENKVDELLDDLLSGNCEDFDGDGAVNLLQERLQIKPVNIDNLSLPDMQDIRGNDLNASERETSQHRQALSDIQNILKGLHSKSPSKSGDVSRKNIPSPQTKSPLAPLILLKRRKFKDNSIDPFSAANIDVAATKNSPLSNCLRIHSDGTGTRKDPSTSGKSKSPMVEEDAGLSRYSSNDSNERFKLDFMTLEEDLPDSSADIDSRTEKVAVTSPHFDVGMQNSTIGEVNHNEHNQEDTSHRSTLKDDGTGGTFASTDRAPEKQTELLIDFAGAPKNSLSAHKKSKARPSKDRLRKGLSRRQSLAAAGTSWNSGVRRSTRIRSRPLEYWKGERFLYGRVHESLATVIGIKYVSPGKADGKSTMRVKSYVSDEYKELVELASLH
ncbi:centromere protein C isoform X2 [Rhodamnia argentea]|uniref:Centromere protein C isoform X2 n=1 Tax=Rhodamnia argentea TaxID=178133 RepID=A0A8B8NSW7_9MYRT|nr:centromere protein C isoform X2 [Rhodamnia argentea]